MKKYITSLLTVFFALTVAGLADDKAMIEAHEKAAWQAYKDKKADDFKKLIDKDIRCVYGDGVSNLQKELADMQKWDIKSFTISNFDSFSDEKDVFVTTYTVKLEGSVSGTDISGMYNAGSVWKKEGKDWLGIFHTAMKQAADASANAHKNE